MDEVFELLFAQYPAFDIVVWIDDVKHRGYWRWRCYHDGGWLEGYDSEPVIYWGA